MNWLNNFYPINETIITIEFEGIKGRNCQSNRWIKITESINNEDYANEEDCDCLFLMELLKERKKEKKMENWKLKKWPYNSWPGNEWEQMGTNGNKWKKMAMVISWLVTGNKSVGNFFGRFPLISQLRISADGRNPSAPDRSLQFCQLIGDFWSYRILSIVRI